MESVSQGTLWIFDDNRSFDECLSSALEEKGWDVHTIQRDFVIKNYQKNQNSNVVAILNANLLGSQVYEILSVLIFGSFHNTNMLGDHGKLRVYCNGMEFAKELRMDQGINFKGGILILSFEPEENLRAGQAGDLLETHGCACVRLPCLLSELIDGITKLQNRQLSSVEQSETAKKLRKGKATKLLSGFQHSCQNLSGILTTAINGLAKATDKASRLDEYELLRDLRGDIVRRRMNELRSLREELLLEQDDRLEELFDEMKSNLQNAQSKYNELLRLLQVSFAGANFDAIITTGKEIVSFVEKAESLISVATKLVQQE